VPPLRLGVRHRACTVGRADPADGLIPFGVSEAGCPAAAAQQVGARRSDC
jgi:hypothetical protein